MARRKTDYTNLDPSKLSQKEREATYKRLVAAINMRVRRESKLKGKEKDFVGVSEFHKKINKLAGSLMTMAGNISSAKSNASTSNINKLISIISAPTAKAEFKKVEKFFKESGATIFLKKLKSTAPSDYKEAFKIYENIKEGRAVGMLASFDEIYEEYNRHGMGPLYHQIEENFYGTEHELRMNLIEGLKEELKADAMTKMREDMIFNQNVTNMVTNRLSRESSADLIGPRRITDLGAWQDEIAYKLYVEQLNWV